MCILTSSNFNFVFSMTIQRASNPVSDVYIQKKLHIKHFRTYDVKSQSYLEQIKSPFIYLPVHISLAFARSHRHMYYMYFIYAHS